MTTPATKGLFWQALISAVLAFFGAKFVVAALPTGPQGATGYDIAWFIAFIVLFSLFYGLMGWLQKKAKSRDNSG